MAKERADRLEVSAKERPILFSGEMVRAILDGRKTQTRRVVKGDALGWLAPGMFTPEFVASPENFLCPYGHPGDRLWVRETWNIYDYCSGEYGGPGELGYPLDRIPKQEPGNGVTIIYGADDQDGPWRPSIHMPRWASRILLEITDVRIERLQEISEEDAVKEGRQAHAEPICTAAGQFRDLTARQAFLAGDWAQAIQEKHENP